MPRTSPPQIKNAAYGLLFIWVLRLKFGGLNQTFSQPLWG
jgi:hypothetical protein